jgi:MFS family permease
MRTESRLFLGVAVFLWASAGVYGFWSWDEIGATALLVSGGLCGLCGSYFAFISRRIQPRPEDRQDAEISEGAGEMGFFSPGSYWPFGLALSAFLGGIGIAFWFYWLMALGAIALFFTLGGFLFEYYIGQD